MLKNSSNKANEVVSKYKLLSSYGGPGSIVHTQFGSIIISCIEEWGFLKKITDLENEATQLYKKGSEKHKYIIEQAKLAKNGNLGFSNDERLLESLVLRKGIPNLKYLILFPDIEVGFDNMIKEGKSFLSIPSSFMPKVFIDNSSLYKPYKDWYNDWKKNSNIRDFFPPKTIRKLGYSTDNQNSWHETLKQDNLVLICHHGHISDFPWSKFLNWRWNHANGIDSKKTIDLFNVANCCGNEHAGLPQIRITSSSANASGFDGKWLKCENCKKQVSLKGIMSLKVKCPGHKPWEAAFSENDNFSYFGNSNARNSFPPVDSCESKIPMKVALTTGNNLYFSRILSSIYLPSELYKNDIDIELNRLRNQLESAIAINNFSECVEIQAEIKKLEAKNENLEDSENLTLLDSEKDILFRNQEFNAFANKTIDEINVNEKFLKVFNATDNLGYAQNDLPLIFSRILRIDNMKLTSAQLDFSRVEPADADAEDLALKSIYRSNNKNQIIAYPVVENYGEGIFFAFNNQAIEEYATKKSEFLSEWMKKLKAVSKEYNNADFSKKAVDYGIINSWQLYLVHTFSHLIMRELEFKCGYPTASLSERIYVSNDEKYKMYGFMIYTAEGAEGSMGGLIAQTKGVNLINLISNALERATICQSDPLCWDSEGQGLFDLNFAACFSCGLVSETSCELRNIYLDRKLLLDNENGFFSNIIRHKS